MHSTMHFRTCLGLMLIAVCACDAPRNNPLDPQNPDYSFGTLQGRVTCQAGPSQPISAATLSWPSEQRQILSDLQGRFQVTGIERRPGWLYAGKPGFAADSQYIEWGEQQIFDVDFALDALPVIDSLAVYSLVLNGYPDKQTLQIGIATRVSDLDGDIDSVIAVNPQLGWSAELPYTSSTRLYANIFSLYQFGLRSLEPAIGSTFEIWATDENGGRHLLRSERLIRVIQDPIKFIEPADYQIVPPQTRFVWEAFEPGFSFVYRLQIFSDEIFPQQIWQSGRIAADQTTLTLDSPLPQGDYFWVIWCIDAFQNRARSRPASFSVH